MVITELSEDALVQAAATIVAAQIAAEIFSTDMTDEAVIASAVEGAMRAVHEGAKRFHADQARRKTPANPDDGMLGRAPDKERR